MEKNVKDEEYYSMSAVTRNSNHELLRIIAMYMIVFIHANMYLDNFCTGSIGSFFNGFVNGICNIGVSCFILISGYYGVKFSVQKLVKMECMMITFSLLETVILCVLLPDQMQGAALLEQLVKSFFPFITRKYWFYSCYICLFLLSGYIQKFIDQLKQKEFERLLVLLIVLFSVLPTLFYFELVPDNGKGFVQMIMVYLIGRYIRVYCDKPITELGGKRKAIGVFVFLWIINGISHEFPVQIGGIYHHLCKDNSITNIVMAVILFYLFKELKLQSKFINKVGAYVFAVFALNNSLVTAVMKLLERKEFESIDGIFGFLILAVIVFGILAICLLVGVTREAVLKRADKRIGEIIEKRI